MQPAARMMKACEGRERHDAIVTNKSKHFTREEHSIHSWFLPEKRLLVDPQWGRQSLAYQFSSQGVKTDRTRQSQPDLDFLQTSECGVPIEREDSIDTVRCTVDIHASSWLNA